jgi:hypothetical protein
MMGVIAVVVLGCAKGDVGDVMRSGNAGSGGTSATGTAGSAGTTTGTAGSMGGGGGTGVAGTGGAAGTTACVMPPTAHMAWTIGRDATGAEVPCDQAGAATVQLLMNSIRSEFTCGAKMGTTPGLVPGAYTPRVLLVGAQGTVLSQGNLPPLTIPSCGAIALTSVRFLVTASSAGTGGVGGTGGTGGGAGGSTGTGGTGGTGGGTGPCDAMPIFAVHSCAVDMACHDNKGSAAAFDMKTVGWEKRLVGISPKAGGGAGLGSVCTNVGMPYLVAGSVPARGLFLGKLMQTKPPCGAQMPLIPPNLTAQELDCVQRWANALTKP